MNNAIIPPMPQADPAKFSKEELLKAFLLLQEVESIHSRKLREVNSKLAEMCVCAHELGAQLYALVDSFDANDQEAIAAQLKAMSERRKSFKKPGEH